MSDPRSIAQVVTAASALQGVGVTMDVSNAAVFAVAQEVELYPSQYGDGAPLARAGQTVRYLISAIAGAQLTGQLNTDGYANPPQVEAGWIIDGTAPAEVVPTPPTPPTALPFIVIDGTTYAKTRAGIQAAITAAEALGVPAKIVCNPGDSITWDATPLLITKSDITIDAQNCKWLLPAGATSVRYLNVQGSLQAAGSLLATSVALGDRVIKMAAGAWAARGFADGDYAVIIEPGPTNNNFQMFRIVAHGAAGTRLAGATDDWIQISEAAAEDFPTGNAPTVYRVGAYGLAGAGTPPQNVKVKDVQLIGNGNTGTTSFGLFAQLAVRPQFEGIFASGLPESAVYLDYVYDPQVTLRSVACGSDQTANLQAFRLSNGLLRSDVLDAPIRTPYTGVAQGGDFNNVTNPLAVANFVANYPSSGVANGYVGYWAIENEVMFISSVVGGTATFTRGVDGSTNVAHPNGAVLYHASGGFGVDVIFGNRVTVEVFTSSTAGRGAKGSQVSRCTFSGKVDNSRFGATGLLISGHDNEVVGFDAWKCGSSGLELIGDRNVVTASSFRFNGTTDGQTDIWIVSGTGNVIEKSVVYGTLTDAGTTSFWWSPWQSYTPTVTQGGAIASFASNLSRWTRTGRTIHFLLHLVISNPGGALAANDIEITLPVNAYAGGLMFTVGTGQIYDSSTNALYRAFAAPLTASTMKLSPTNSGAFGYLGTVDFALALALNDYIVATGTYEAV